MKRIYRLKKNYQFNYVYRKGKTTGNDLLVLHYAKNNNGRIKVGICVSKRFGKAVQRNKVKRRLRFAFAQILSKVNHGYNYIVMPREKASECDYKQLYDALAAILTKAGMLDVCKEKQL